VTEIIYALGRESLLVGNTIYCDYPEEAKKVFKVGDFSAPSLERILFRKPNLVIATLPEQKLIVEQLKRHNLAIYISQPRSIENIFAEIIQIGNLLNAQAEAESLVMKLKDSLRVIQNKNPNLLDSPSVYIEINSNPLMSAGSFSYLNEIIKAAGGKNIFSNINQEYLVINPEEVVVRNPDIIVALYPRASKTLIKKRLGWDKITAVKKNQIYVDLNSDWFFRPGPRFINAVAELSKITHTVWLKKEPTINQ
jgi:iron complex transport system substrate-binding protein